MPNSPTANTAPARTVADSASLPKLRRTLDQYANCTPAAVSGGSQAQMAYFVEDAKHDIAALVKALREAEKVIGFYANAENYKQQLVTEDCGCCSYWHNEKIGKEGDEGEVARDFLKSGSA